MSTDLYALGVLDIDPDERLSRERSITHMSMDATTQDARACGDETSPWRTHRTSCR
jgi:hypothetical protein